MPFIRSSLDCNNPPVLADTGEMFWVKGSDADLFVEAGDDGDDGDDGVIFPTVTDASYIFLR